jgi:CBS domain-containing protein
MKLHEVMIKEVIQVTPAETVVAAATRMRDKAVGCLVATLDGAVKGIITDRDLLSCLAHMHDPYQCKVTVHMHRPVIVLRPDEDLGTAVNVMRERKIKRLPVAQNGKLVGIVSMSDLAALASVEAEQLRSSLGFCTAVLRAQAFQSNRGPL